MTHALMAGFDFKRNAERHAEDGGNYDTSANTLDVLAPDYIRAPDPRSRSGRIPEARNPSRKAITCRITSASASGCSSPLNGRWDDVVADAAEGSRVQPERGRELLRRAVGGALRQLVEVLHAAVRLGRWT